MVVKDFNDNSDFQIHNAAPFLDRFFANVINLLILGPVIALFTSGIKRDIRWDMFNQDSSEFFIHILQYGFVTFSLFLLYEIVFIYFNGATPGHQFVFLKLVSEDNKKLTILQIFFRTIFKFQALLCLFLPFVEIVLRSDRSSFYDRLSKSKIISLKPGTSDQIHPDFKNLILRWVHISIALVFLFLGTIFYRTTMPPSRSVASVKAPIKCQDDLSRYLKSYLSKSRESENLNCARIVVEKSFEKKGKVNSLNFLAQLVISPNDELRSSYKKKYCQEQPQRSLCQAGWAVSSEDFKPDEEDIINLLIQLNSALAKNSHQAVFSILDLLYTHLDWNKNLELYYLTAYIQLSEKSSRSPASKEDLRVNLSKWPVMKSRFLERISSDK